MRKEARTVDLLSPMILARLIERLLPSRCRIQRIGNTCIAYNPRHTIFIREYYLYIVALFKAALATSPTHSNVVFGNYAVDFNNPHTTLRIDIQFEHTLVKPGGRDSDGAVAGRVPLSNGDGFYRVRIANLAHLDKQDFVVEYSQANMFNVSSAGVFSAFASKLVYIAPMLYDADFVPRRADDAIISLCFDLHQSRRRIGLDAIRSAGVPLRNVKHVFDKRRLAKIYARTRILVNLHQTDHHDTLEELRILPALLCGVIVVSEDVPLREQVPYHRFIVWSSYAALADTVKEVDENYAHHHARIFDDPELRSVLTKMRAQNIRNVANTVNRMAGA